jgi:hypothetical protein
MDAHSYSTLAEVLNDAEVCHALKQFMQEHEETEDEIAIPDELDEPNELFAPEDGFELPDPSQPKSTQKVKPKKKFVRKQAETADKPIVKSSKQKAATSARSSSPGLSDALSKVQLEPEEPPKPTLKIAKPVEESKVAKRKQRLSARPKPETPPLSTSAPEPPIPAEPVLQHLGQNSDFKVSIQEVSADGNRLEFTASLTNISESPLTRIDVDLVQSAAVKPVEIPRISETIAPQSKTECKLVLAIQNPSKPAMARVVFTPVSCGGEPLDLKIKVFPSYFLQPAKAGAVDAGECAHEGAASGEIQGTPQDCLKRIVKVLRCKMVTDKATKMVKLYAKASYGAAVAGAFSVDGGRATVTIASTVAELTDSLVSEIEMNLKSL